MAIYPRITLRMFHENLTDGVLDYEPSVRVRCALLALAQINIENIPDEALPDHLIAEGSKICDARGLHVKMSDRTYDNGEEWRSDIPGAVLKVRDGIDYYLGLAKS